MIARAKFYRDRVIGAVFVLFGVWCVVSATAEVFSVVWDRMSTGQWHFQPLIVDKAWEALSSPTLAQRGALWLMHLPRFLPKAVIGVLFVRNGLTWWLGTAREANADQRT